MDRTLPLYDLTHEIPAYNIWEASYRLYQTLQYWPKGTVFVSVVDPGVGTERKSVVLKTKSGHYIVSPDNGTLTLVAEHFGIDTVRQIDEKTNRLKGSEKSYTFHGRDVYAYTGARLASGAISYEQVGPKLPAEVVKIPYQPAVAEQDGTLKGTIPILDVQYGNVWTNIDDSLLTKAGINKGDNACIKISEGDALKYEARPLCQQLWRCATRPAAGLPQQPVTGVGGAEHGQLRCPTSGAIRRQLAYQPEEVLLSRAFINDKGAAAPFSLLVQLWVLLPLERAVADCSRMGWGGSSRTLTTTS